MRNSFSIKNKGFSVVEILVAVSMAGIMIVSIGGALNSIHKLNARSEINEKAIAYAKQTLELVTDLKNHDFDADLSSVDSLALETGFTRPSPAVTVTPLCRDGNGNIMSACGASVPDGKTEKVTVIIQYSGTEKAKLSTIFTDWRIP
ncbi:MAG: hypothetical protein WC528_04765 [Patescibacteria group bacterium]